MSKRVFEVAKELGVESKVLLARLKEAGVALKDHLATMKPDQEELAKRLFETPKPGDTSVTRVGGAGRVVRRRVAAETPKAAETPAAEAPVVGAARAAPAEAEEPAVQPAAGEATATPEVAPEAAVQGQPPESGVAIGPEVPVPEAQGPGEGTSLPVGGTEKAATAPAAPPEVPATPPPPPPVVVARPADGSTREALKALVEAGEKAKAPKQKRLVYDRRSDVLQLRELRFTKGDDDLETETQRQATRRRSRNVQRRGRPQKTQLTIPKESKRTLRVEAESITVGELAHAMGLRAPDLVRKLMQMGVMAGVNQALDLDTAGIVAAEYGYTIEKVGFDPATYLQEQPDGELELMPRPPVVTVMGHVDHGKTTLLDRIRSANVAEHEAGGITQHIGAYTVQTESGAITFIDTPGHEAFTQMRARGAGVTDIVILVVAADDGVMAQTKEAIAHARAANVPILVAVNKIDKPEANPERVRRELAEEGLVPEDWGGSTIFCEISAKKNLGIDNLMEMVLLQAQVLELKANPNKPGRGTVLEARLDNRLGPLATVLVQGGTLKVGDPVVAGMAFGRVRAMQDDKGRAVQSVGPSMPARIAGLNLVPDAGDPFVVLPDEKKAREVAEYALERQKKARLAASGARVTLEDFYQRVQSGGMKELRVIVRADVQGSLAPLVESITKLRHPEISLRVIHSAVGAVTESDVNLAMASDAVIVGFSVAVDPKAQHLAEQEGVEIRRYNIIYEAIEDLKKAMEGLLAPKMVMKLIGKAEVRKVFQVSKVGQIAGTYVLSGHVVRSAEIKVVRGKETVFTGRLSSLKRYKDDVREVKQGLECGIAIDGFEDLQEGDLLEFYEQEAVRETVQVV
ncbi:translation initiation factor IF-2 [Myxococcota bacterium]|nr:translation initiation factor IF-2 [Myxococcota bacterium]